MGSSGPVGVGLAPVETAGRLLEKIRQGHLSEGWLQERRALPSSSGGQ
jgi:hypothetical protein